MEEKKNYYSDAQKRATMKYIKKAYDRITIRVPKGKRELYAKALESRGLSMNNYVLQKLEELL